MDEEVKCKCPPPGLPAWFGTFSDLMALLMCFFVLLLSFSEMDVLKFRQLAGSMKFAFGVQNQVELLDPPKGTSIIAQEFSPGRPDPTPIEVIMQQTIDSTKDILDFQEGESDRSGGVDKEAAAEQGGQTESTNTKQQENIEAEQEVKTESEASQEMEELAESISQALQLEIKDGAIELENLGQQININIDEQGAFPKDSAFLQPKLRAIIRKVALLAKDVPGKIIITGHTDNSPVTSELYRSNWDLSAQRAVSVAQEMSTIPGFDTYRLEVRGLADTAPLVPNDTPNNRAKNRRVEIQILQGEVFQSDKISADK